MVDCMTGLVILVFQSSVKQVITTLIEVFELFFVIVYSPFNSKAFSFAKTITSSSSPNSLKK